MTRCIAISLAMLVLASVGPGVAQQTPRQATSGTDVLCAEPYACVEQTPLTEAETLANLRHLQVPAEVSRPVALEHATAPSTANSVRR
jgi:hypothetical protein